MKKRTLSILAASLVMGCAAWAQSTNCPGGGTPQGDQIRQRDQDRLQTCSPDLEQSRTRLQQCLPGEVKEAVQNMARVREQYQQQLRERKKEIAACTDQERDQLREQLRDQLRDQARDREQLRERLRELRECLPSHQELMEQAREQTRDRERRGGE